MRSLRPSGFDEMGLRRALSDRMLLLLVAAMALLAALALAGWFGTAALSRHWQHGAGVSLTVQVPRATESSARGDQTRLAAVLDLLVRSPVVASTRALSDHELRELLTPWLGHGVEQLAIPIPAVIAVRLTEAAADADLLSRRLSEAAPGTLVEDPGIWISRLAVFARSLQACAALALLLVAVVAAAVIGVATRAGLSARREAIEIVHGLGATDRYITSRFSERATFLAAVGSAVGTIAALPILLTLAHIAAPFSGETHIEGDPLANALGALPVPLWLALPGVPASAAAIGYATAYGAVRWWLRRLP
jgi:cell division transport system permease protein